MNELELYIGTYFEPGQAYIQQLAAQFTPSHLNKHDFHTKSGSFHSNLSFIKSGFLRVFDYHEGKEITQWISSPGEFITDLAGILFQMPARWNIQAMTDCELYTISSEAYQNLGQLIPVWDKLEKGFLAKCFLTLENRVYSFLSLSAEERYKKLFAEKKELFNQIPLHYLASMLGMTPETLSRIRRKVIS